MSNKFEDIICSVHDKQVYIKRHTGKTVRHFYDGRYGNKKMRITYVKVPDESRFLKSRLNLIIDFVPYNNKTFYLSIQPFSSSVQNGIGKKQQRKRNRQFAKQEVKQGIKDFYDDFCQLNEDDCQYDYCDL